MESAVTIAIKCAKPRTMAIISSCSLGDIRVTLPPFDSRYPLIRLANLCSLSVVGVNTKFCLISLAPGPNTGCAPRVIPLLIYWCMISTGSVLIEVSSTMIWSGFTCWPISWITCLKALMGTEIRIMSACCTASMLVAVFTLSSLLTLRNFSWLRPVIVSVWPSSLRYWANHCPIFPEPPMMAMCNFFIFRSPLDMTPVP